jgi:hypothetical protein
MPSFPRYESKGALTTQTPSVGAVEDTSGKIAAQAADTLTKVQDTAVKWDEAFKTIQDTVFKGNTKVALADVKARAEVDPDPNSLPKYLDEIDKIGTDNSKGLHAGSQAFMEWGFDSKIAKIELGATFKKKQIDVGHAATLKLVDAEVENPTDGSLPRIQSLLQTQVSKGLINHEDAYKLEEKANRGLGINRVNNDLFNAQTSEQVDAVKQNLQSGAYEKGGVTIDPKEKVQMLRSIEVRGRQVVTKEHFAQRVERQDLVHDLTDQANNGILSGQTLEEAFLTKGISNSTYTSLQQNANSPVGPTAETDHQTYYNLTHYLLQDNVDPIVAIKKILDANSEGKLSRADQQKLFDMHLTPTKNGDVSLKDMIEAKPKDSFDKLKQVYDERIKNINEKRKWFRPAFQSFNEAFTGPDRIKNISEAQQTLLDSVQKNNLKDGEILKEADKITAAANLKKHPEWGILPDTGQSGQDRFKNKVIVYPDGRVVRKK